MLGVPELPGAVCAQHPDPDLWFRSDGWREAMRLCGRCPALMACREYGDQAEAEMPARWWVGVWAGETPGQREKRRGERCLKCHVRPPD